MEVVFSRRPSWRSSDEWHVSDLPRMTVGGVVDDPAYLLSRVEDVRRLPGGEVVVLDGASSSLRVFDASGVHVRDIGGPGDGPSELSRPQAMVVEDEAIIVYEPIPPTLTSFTLDGRFIGTGRLLDGGRTALPRAVHVDGEGWVIAVGPQFDRTRPAAGTQREERVVWRLTPDAPPDSLTHLLGDVREMGDGGQGMTVVREELFGPTGYVAGSPERLWVAQTEQWAIQVLDADGSPVRVVKRASESVAVRPDDVRQRAEETLLASGRDLSSAGDIERRLRAGPVAAVMPVHGAMVVDAGGNLWVEEWAGVGVEQGAFAVFDSTGVWLGRVSLPNGLRWPRGTDPPLEIGSDYVLGVWEGVGGAEEVRLYDLEKPNR